MLSPLERTIKVTLAPPVKKMGSEMLNGIFPTA